MDWKATLNLPKTDFAMRADMAKREPAWLARWAAEAGGAGQLERILGERRAAGAPAFVLHDGPPYPTGAIHYGTAMNKVLKDIVVRSRLMMGFAAPFRPGWDCHGLPIEQQVEKELGGKRRELSVPEFRERCRAHAEKFVDVMRAEFKRLGCLGDWDHPYLTLLPEYEATIVRELAGFARAGLLYRDKKPVHWCMTHRTALAEAEVEYADHASPSVYVRFPLDEAVAREVLGGPASLVIWTTTPWTLPANLAVVGNPALEYVAIPDATRGGECLIVARGLAASFLAACGIEAPEATWRPIAAASLAKLEGQRYQHPFIAQPKADADFRFWFAPHATLEAGTGLVHTAPGHGADDYVFGKRAGLAVFAPVDESGRLTDEVAVPEWRGLPVFEANPKIAQHLFDTGYLLNKPGESIKHQYPCCWRCKKPVIFRGTEQWFARLDGDAAPTLRTKALQEIEKTEWIPSWGQERIGGMIATRPDWCLSRQRTWGVPIPAFACACGRWLLEAPLLDAIAAVFEREGSNAWFTRPASELVPTNSRCACGRGPAEWHKGGDIVDVWFESGVSWAAVAEGKLVPKGEKVDLYLEGSDQHRGWFHSSLLASVATRGQAPYKAVLTHGWVLDERGKVYSKSEIAKAKEAGAKLDYVDPAVWMEKNGAEILRLWAGASDFQRDVVFGKTIIDQLAESYRKVRNTCRYLLSNLYDFVPSRDALPPEDLRELDLAALAVIADRDNAMWKAYGKYAFADVVRILVDTCITMSAEYFEPVKDVLYCEAPHSRARRSVQTVLHAMLRSVTQAMAPILCFTAQDVADEFTRLTGEPFDVHGTLRPHDEEAMAKVGRGYVRFWTETLRDKRELVNKSLEPFRKAGNKSVAARVTIQVPEKDAPAWSGLENLLLELCVVSQLRIETAAVAEPTVTVEAAPEPTCPRCWRHTGERSGDARDPDLCPRCSQAVPQS